MEPDPFAALPNDSLSYQTTEAIAKPPEGYTYPTPSVPINYQAPAGETQYPPPGSVTPMKPTIAANGSSVGANPPKMTMAEFEAEESLFHR